MTDHQVVIIGSGAAGGMAAYTLARLGVKCVLLEAGPLLLPDKHRELRSVSDLPYRGFGEPDRFPHIVQASEFDANIWLDEKKNPYTYDKDARYNWVRIRAVGGKTLRWGRASWRLSNYEFKCKDHDGVGDNWPVSYDDLAPFYGRAEALFHVTGRNEGLPQLPDGNIISNESTESESVRRFIASAEKLGIRTTKPRVATGTFASSANLLLPDALATGNLKVIANAVVREITVDKDTGKANGVRYIHRQSRQDYFIPARTIILGASTLESVRILLNSRSRQHPEGLGNSSGVLGKYLFDQFYIKSVVTAIVPEARGRASRRLMGGGGYVVRFRNIKDRSKNFVRGYTYDFHSGSTPHPRYLPLYGEPLLKELAALNGVGFGMTTMGEVLARKENYARIDTQVKDYWGIPVLHLDHRYTDNEHAMARDSMEMAEQMCRGAGFEILAKHSQMVPPGESIHELGGCRMGENPKTSVLNRYNRLHDVRNLFVVDGSSFVSGGAQNPTLTILALSMRASEHLAESLRKGDV